MHKPGNRALPKDIAKDFYLEAKRFGLPVRMVAVANDGLVGTIFDSGCSL